MSRFRIRISLLLIVLVLGGFVGSGYVAYATGGSQGAVGDVGVTDTMSSNITVITTQPSDSVAKGKTRGISSELTAVRSNGSIIYQNASRDNYWDVDPSPEGRYTVSYIAADILSASECGATMACSRVVIERTNLSTGETTRLYTHLNPLPMQEIGNGHSSRWHDVDRIGQNRFLIADIFRDEVFIVNTSTGVVEWEWHAQSAFPPESGGDYPQDWTHMNDVEMLQDGRVMVSLRNQDQVVFIDPEKGIQEDWTLGADNDYNILYEQHNPDYIPPERGGPAVIVADSENNRIVEYQREAGEWRRSWIWTDLRLAWPRDADRLPNGNTLITDSRGGRVLEIDDNGDIVWEIEAENPYEAERLGTGDESAGGESATRLGLESSNAAANDAEKETGGGGSSIKAVLKSVVPSKIWNGIAFVAPAWMGFLRVGASILLAIVVVGWGAIEYRWLNYSVTIQSPFRIR